MLSRHVNLKDLSAHVPHMDFVMDNPRLIERISIEAEYSVYVKRQRNRINDIKREAMLVIPDTLDLSSVSGLSNECKEILVQAQPANVSVSAFRVVPSDSISRRVLAVSLPM